MDLSLNIITRSLTIPLNCFAIAALLSACSILVLVLNESRMAYQVNMLITLGLYTIFDCSFYTPIDPVDKECDYHYSLNSFTQEWIIIPPIRRFSGQGYIFGVLIFCFITSRKD